MPTSRATARSRNARSSRPSPPSLAYSQQMEAGTGVDVSMSGSDAEAVGEVTEEIVRQHDPEVMDSIAPDADATVEAGIATLHQAVDGSVSFKQSMKNAAKEMSRNMRSPSPEVRGLMERMQNCKSPYEIQELVKDVAEFYHESREQWEMQFVMVWQIMTDTLYHHQKDGLVEESEGEGGEEGGQGTVTHTRVAREVAEGKSNARLDENHDQLHQREPAKKLYRCYAELLDSLDAPIKATVKESLQKKGTNVKLLLRIEKKWGTEWLKVHPRLIELLGVEPDRPTWVISRRKLQALALIAEGPVATLTPEHILHLESIVEQRRRETKARLAQPGNKGGGLGGRAAMQVSPTDIKKWREDEENGRTAGPTMELQSRAKKQMEGKAKAKNTDLTLVGKQLKDRRQTAEAEGGNEVEAEDEAEAEDDAEDVDTDGSVQGETSAAQMTNSGWNAVNRAGVAMGSTRGQGKSSNATSRTSTTAERATRQEADAEQPCDSGQSSNNGSGSTSTNKRSRIDSSSSLSHRPKKRNRHDKSMAAALDTVHPYDLTSRRLEKEEVKACMEAMAAQELTSCPVPWVLAGIRDTVNTVVYNLKMVLELKETRDLPGQHPAEPCCNGIVRRALSALDLFGGKIVACQANLPHPLDRPIHINRRTDEADVERQRDGDAGSRSKNGINAE